MNKKNKMDITCPHCDSPFIHLKFKDWIWNCFHCKKEGEIKWQTKSSSYKFTLEIILEVIE
jgi:ribosomal protein L37AE/L43A